MSKLDRFFISEGVSAVCPDLSANVLNNVVSDHRPILLKQEVMDYGPRVFRFFNSWLDEKDFEHVVVSSWNGDDQMVQGGAAIKFKNKLKRLKENIKCWWQETKNRKHNEKQMLLDEIQQVDDLLDQRLSTDEDRLKRSQARLNLYSLDYKVIKDLAQKAKIKWSIEGDENSRSFHGIINSKRRYLAIRGIKREGTWVSDPSQVKEVFLNHIRGKFSRMENVTVSQRSTRFKSLSEEQSNMLIGPISMHELKDAVWSCGNNKAQGPDGFIFSLVKRYWKIFKTDILEFVSEFFVTGFIPTGCNSSFIILIPKVINPMGVSDYRPISLICIQYKSIAKVLALRLAKVVDSIDDGVYAFFDSVEEMNPCIPSFGKGVHPNKWESYSMEGLHVAMEDAIESNFFQGLRIGNDEVSISHLLYADDVLFMGEWSSTNIHNLLIILHYFYVSSGLKINLHKSNLYGIRVKGNEVQIMAQQIRVCHGKLPFDYLGLSVGGKMSRIKAWEGLVNRFHKRLSKWKVSTLSIGGRVMLIKTVLGGGDEVKKIPWVKWKSVMASYDNEGLNIRSLEAFNIALLLKWRWRFVSNSNMLWVKVIKEIYGVNGGFDQQENRGSQAQPWARIIKLHSSLVAKGIDISGRLSKRVSNGSDTRFWGKIGLLAMRWNTLVPRKVNILFWRVALDRIPTRSNLLMRGIYLSDIMCVICGNEIEERDHVFSSCDVAVCTWRAVFRWLQLSTVSMGTINDTMQWVDLCGMLEKKKKVIEAKYKNDQEIDAKFSHSFADVHLEIRNNVVCQLTNCRGDIFVFPKGLVHFQFNNDAKNPVVALSAFGSANAGTVDTVQLETAINTISHEYLLEFTSEYSVPKTLHPALPGPEDRIVDFPERKIGVYTRVFLTVMDWRTNAPKDGMPAEGAYSIEVVRVLDTHRTSIKKQPEMLLCLVGISRRYYLGDELYPTFLHDDDRSGYGLVQFDSCPKSYKGEDRKSPRAPHKVPLLTLTTPRVIKMDEPAATDSSGVPSTIERSPLDFAHEAEVSDQGTAALEMPSSEDVPATAAPGAGQAEETATMDPPAALESHKRGRDGTDVNAPPKSLRRDHADPRPSESSHGGKSLAAIQLGLASTVVVPEDAPVGVSDPDPLSFADAPSRHPVNVAQSSPGIAAAREPKSENASSSAEVGSPRSVYQPKWGVANGSLLDTPKACQDLVDHVAPPGYFSELRHMHNEEFLRQYNVNLARQVAMGSQLRLRFEQEAKLLKKFVAQVARQDKIIQARELEIRNLEASMEAEANAKRAAEDKSRRLRLAVRKCGESLELRQAFADVVSARIAKGLNEGLRHGLEHDQAQRSLESIEAYDPEAKAKFVAALQALKDLKYPLVDQLEGLRDALMDVIMAAMYLESDTGDDASQDIRDLRPSSSQLTIPVYPEVRDPLNPWTYKEEIGLADAIAANISHAKKKKKCRIVCRTHGVGSAYHA
nr:putative RNA-directed DNA polymerase, eukaryota, reverse transcriptase zinc-binding domain protein [Tanacetum cinerariifolium]